MLKCQREGWSCLSGSFLRKMNLPWFPAWVLDRLRSPCKEQPVHSFYLQMRWFLPAARIVTRGSSARGLGVLLAQGELIKLRLNFNTRECESSKGPGEGEFPHFPEREADAQGHRAGRARGGEGSKMAAYPYQQSFRSPDLPTSPTPQLEFVCWGQKRGQWEGQGRTRND